MRFRGLDLNLLVALDVLLAERNVSSAARRLFLSQSAMSGALARLREHFQDDLLVPVGRGMAPTAFAEGLVEPLRRLILQIEVTISPGLAFDPAASRRRFTIAASDYIVEVVLAPVIASAARAAPGVVLDILAPDDDQIAALQAGGVDLLILPDTYLPDNHPIETLYEETHVAVAWTGNEALRGGILTRDLFNGLGHVVTRFSRNRFPSFAETHLASLARERRIEIIAPAFTLAPKLVVGTQRIAVMHRRLAEIYAAALPLRVLSLPFDLPPMRESLQYHQARSRDGGLEWLRATIRRHADPGGRSRPPIV